MPRRRWRPASEETLARWFSLYHCPHECPANSRVTEMFGVMTDDITEERKVDGRLIPLGKQIVNGWQMRAVIADFLEHLSNAIQNDRLKDWPDLKHHYQNDASAFIGLSFGCLSDLCFNLEYVRRITDKKWAYCNRYAGHPRAYYPYLGVCPYCIVKAVRPTDAMLGVTSAREIAEASRLFAESEEPAVEAEGLPEEADVRRRYFGNKIQSHHVGRIGERVLTFILDLIGRSHDPNAVTGIVFDDQHEVDTVFFFNNLATLTQIKAAPLILLPSVVELPAPLTAGVSLDTGLPEERSNHSFTDLSTAGYNLGLYISLTNTTIPIGPKQGESWPYQTFREQLSLDLTLQLLDNWVAIYHSFLIPKEDRSGDDIRRAWLTAGWGAPIDDNKAKPGLARSDNMMKGTYACLKYGAHFVQECTRGTMRASLVSTLDPVHQYIEYLEKLEDIRWGHRVNFSPLVTEEGKPPTFEVIESRHLTYLFDSVFTFNRQVLNDRDIEQAWNLKAFAEKLAAGTLQHLLDEMRRMR
jgi:hypothetical protein